MTDYDVIIIGGGIAGASAAYEVSRGKRVLLLEREAQPGYHATGRAAAVFIDAYENEEVQALTAASRPFMEHPPADFCAGPLLSDRELFVVGTAAQAEIVEQTYQIGAHLWPHLTLVDAAAVEARVPLLRPGVIAKAFHDPDTKDIDVDALLHGFLRGATRHGAEIVTGAEVTALDRRDGRWVVRTPAAEYRAEVIVNAAGAWAGVLAAMAGAAPRGVTPLRRSMYVVPAPAGVTVEHWPLVADIGSGWYFKPESGHIMASPSEEDPVEPCDARPDELVIAEGVDRLQQVLDLEVRRIEQQWAGLRTFAADRRPVVGYAPDAEGFFWLAGQGGFGLQTAPAMARLAAALIDRAPVPADMADRGLTQAAVDPARLGG